MILIFGGAYQNKLEYAKARFNFTDADVFDCDIFMQEQLEMKIIPEEVRDLDLSKRVIDHFEVFVRCFAESGADLNAYLDEHREDLKDKIIISRDETQGLVPVNASDRAYRELLGRTLTKLATESDQVVRVFLGLGQDIK